MNAKPADTPRWYQPWRRSQTSAALDPADLGTCFGLEMTLSAEPAPTTTTGNGQATEPRVNRMGWMGWVQRLASRRRAAA